MLNALWKIIALPLYWESIHMKGISKLTIITACLIAGMVSSFCFLRIGKRFLADCAKNTVSQAAGLFSFIEDLAASRATKVMAAAMER